MNEILKLAEITKLPKELLVRADKLFSKLLGESTKELGGLFADKIRYRRFTNQVKILNKSYDFLKKNNLDPHNINLKLLVPLIEYSSLEENETLQERWAKLLVNISHDSENESLNRVSIDLLSKISHEEAVILDYIYSETKKDNGTFSENVFHCRSRATVVPLENFPFTLELPSNRTFKLEEIKSKVKIDTKQKMWDYYIDNLIGLGILKNAITLESLKPPHIEDDKLLKEMDKHGIKASGLRGSNKLSMLDDFYISDLGYYFVEKCNVITAANN